MTMSIESDLKKVPVLLTKQNEKAVVRAARKSMNKGLTEMHRTLLKEVQKVRAMKLSTLKKKYTEKSRVKGSKLEKLEGVLKVDKRPISMIHFVQGSKRPDKQKNKLPSERRKLKVKLSKGRSKNMKGAFIARVKAGKGVQKTRLHVFRRSSKAVPKEVSGRRKGWKRKTHLPIIRHSVSGLGKLWEKDSVSEPVIKAGVDKHQAVFTVALQEELKKVKL